MQRFRVCDSCRKHRAMCQGFDCNTGASDFDGDYRGNKVAKLLSIASICSLLIFLFSFTCKAESNECYEEFYSESGVYELEQSADEDVRKVFEEFNISLSNPKSFADINGFDLIKKLISISLDDISSPVFALSSICVMAVIYALLSGSLPDISKQDGALSWFLPAASVAIIAMPLAGIIGEAADAVLSCSVFMLSFVPIYAGVLISSGKAATGGAYSALMFTVSQIISCVANRLLVPLCSSMMLASIGSAFNSLCGQISAMLKKAIVTVLTFGMTVFTFILGLQTAISSVSDSVAVKTAKAAMGTFIPIVGSSLGDSLSVILGGVSLFKSGLGVYAIICLLASVIGPLINILLWKATLSLLCAVMQAVDAKSTGNLLGIMSGVLTVLLSILLSCTAVFIISVALTLAGG